ncbi:hypothetical protein [Cysteiniphilum litorale]|uniref:hypothetical protein n=1 Tax=Cysteiniphilum litorale TaxID=2056700 RepID=UPI003F884164
MGGLKQLIEELKGLTYTDGGSGEKTFGDEKAALFEIKKDPMELENLLDLKTQLTNIQAEISGILNLQDVTEEERKNINNIKGKLGRQISILDHFSSLHKYYQGEREKWDATADSLNGSHSNCKNAYNKFIKKCDEIFSSLHNDLINNTDDVTKCLDRYSDKILNLGEDYQNIMFKKDGAVMKFLKSLKQAIINLFKLFCYKVLRVNPGYENRLKGALDYTIDTLKNNKRYDIVLGDSDSLEGTKILSLNSTALKLVDQDKLSNMLEKYSNLEAKSDLALLNMVLTEFDKKRLTKISEFDTEESSNQKVSNYVAIIKQVDANMTTDLDSTKKDIHSKSIKRAIDKPLEKSLGFTLFKEKFGELKNAVTMPEAKVS